ncbi:hypothetical protein [Streptomyces sp. NPDC006638]|uniref:hypothetical protein n=1 Tax=unclassified Streptomyces TaxID=2593676 RepID=UPI0033BCC889
MPEMELVAQALAAGATAGVTQTVQRAAGDAWDGLVSLVRRERRAGDDEEPPGTDAGEPPRDDRAGKYVLVAHEVKGAVMGDHARQDNHFH